MRLLITAVTPERIADLAVDCDADTTVADLAEHIEKYLGTGNGGIRPAPSENWSPAGGDPRSWLPTVTPTPIGPSAPPLWWRGQELNPAAALQVTGLHHGAVIGVGRPVSDMLAEPPGQLELRITGGPGAGRVQRLFPGVYELGSGPHSVVGLHDPDLPERACIIEVGVSGRVQIKPDPSVLGLSRPAPLRVNPLAGPIVISADGEPPRRSWWRRRRRETNRELAGSQESIDPQSEIPLLHLDRRALEAAVEWTPGAVLAAGHVLLEIEVVRAPDASLSPTPGAATQDYNRPPRLLPAERPSKFTLPPEPKRPDKVPIPLAMALAPAVMGGAMFLFTRNPLSLLMMALSPVMAISQFTSGRKTNKRNYKRAMQEFHARDRRVRDAALSALLAERSLRRRDLADPASLLMTATGPRVQLWERRPTDPDWLSARVGTGDVASDITVEESHRESHEGPLRWTTPDVPVAFSLARSGVVGISGPDEVRRSVGRWLVAQAAVLHSPADLDILLLADRDSGRDWSWMRWLPHVRSDDAGVLARIGVDDEGNARLIRELLARIQGVQERTRSFGSAPRSVEPSGPMLVVIDGARRMRLMPGMVSLLQNGPSAGIYFICLDADRRQLPEECQAVVSVTDPYSNDMRVSVTGQTDIEGVQPDLVDVAWCERVARALAPIRDVSSENLAGNLPSSSRLLDALNLQNPDPVRIAQSWRTGGGRTTAAVIGEGTDGLFTLDIRRDGPHGLVAGTTGSGKSELLQTIIASLAVGNRPDQFTFVLIDYKGGAAFKDCSRLPHTVGMVTDLDGHLTTRALESLAAELRRREHQLAKAGAKDIEDYQADPANSLDPMPRLMIVIDEFAALVSELPDFVTGLVDIARRGRSLGVHLILATQRPAGVVSAEIKSNTNLRIALRVTDANDSQDVVDSADAAAIAKSTPGRGYARLGASSLMPFQSSRVGGRPRAPGATAAVALRAFEWTTLALDTSGFTGEDEDDVSIPTDLATLVAALGEATTLAGVRVPPSPWLPPLPESLTLDQLREEFGPADTPADDGRVPPLVFGLEDIPSEQTRRPAGYDLTSSGHMVVVGAPRSGRSTALRAVAGAVAERTSPRDVHLYAVDCGNNALLPLVSMPHTGAVVTRDQPERLSRLTSRILQTIANRQQFFAEKGFADLREQRLHSAPDDRLPYLIVLLDRWEGFMSAFESFDAGRLIDSWMQIMQEGAGAGVKIVMSADRSALVGRISMLMDDKLVLRLVDPSDFGSIGLPLKQVPEAMPPGRAFRAEGLRETQIALTAGDPAGSAQVAALQRLGREAAARTGELPPSLRPFRVDSLPARLTVAEAATMPEEPGSSDVGYLPIAVGGDTLTVLGFDAIAHGPGVLITGPRRTGRSSALCTLADNAAERGWRVVIVTPRQSLLRDRAPAGARQFTPESAQADVTAACDWLLETGNAMLLVDDLEIVGVDGWLPDLIAEQVTKFRDRPSLVVAAGSGEELAGSYRGPAVALKKSRSGVLLSPQTSSEGDLFGVRLPRSAFGGPAVPGRGIIVRAGATQSVQVILPAD